MLGLAGVAHGQSAAPPSNQVEEVVVTGSRLQANGFQTPTPVTTLGTEQLQQRAPTTIADVINQLPAFRQTVTNTQTQRGNGNNGENKVDLRGLGIQRTLVLVDGQRWVPTDLNGTIDINLIPTILVDRVDVVTGGASAAYGSDAVSGVVNFILKDHLEGVQGSVQYGVSEHGDNIEPGASLAAGHSFLDGRLRVIIGGDYSDNKGVGTIYTRDYGRQQVGLVSFGSAATRGNLPAQGLLPNVTYATQAAGGLILSGPLKGIAFGPGGTPYQFQFGTVYSNLMVGGGPNDGSPHANPFGNWFIEAPHKRYTGYAKISYDLTDDTTATFEYGYGHNEQAGLSSYHQSNSLPNPGFIVPITNPFIPASIRQQMVANNLTSITIGRYETDFGGYKLFDQDTTNRFTVGLKGKMADWSWDAYWEHGRTNENQKVLTNIDEANYIAATYVVSDASGNPVCGPLATNPNLTAARRAQVQPGCVPFNLFGPGSASQAALDYVRFTSNNVVHYDQDVIALNIHGQPFSTWAGPVSVAAGVEQRTEKGSSQADPLGAQLVALSNNGVTYAGSFHVTEGYVETGVPLAENVSWAKSLNLNAAVRRTNYSTSGSVTTWKVGLTYEPNDFLRFRVTRSRDIRAPSIAELFSAASQGITATFLNPVTGVTGPEFTISGGNPDLKPEIADSWTAGVVFRPKWGWLDGFDASVDYYKIDIKGVIATVAAQDVASRCAQGLQDYCALMSFTPGLGLTIQSTPHNLAALSTDGFDFEAAYRVPLGNWDLPGSLNIRSLTTHVRSLVTQDAVTRLDRAGSGANGGLPKWTSNLNFTYAIGPSSTNLQIRYTGPLKADAALIGPGQAGYNPALSNSINKNLYPAGVYFDVAEQYDLPVLDGHSLQLFATVTNLFDKQPPWGALIAFINGGDPYDLIGRTYKAGLRFKF
jgi:iron complex outermembrane receptor protein